MIIKGIARTKQSILNGFAPLRLINEIISINPIIITPAIIKEKNRLYLLKIEYIKKGINNKAGTSLTLMQYLLITIKNYELKIKN